MTDRISLCCWKCGSRQENVLLPFSRSQECSACSADLHACRGCDNYETQLSDNCSEDRADSVTNKETANFCDFFKASTQAFRGASNTEADAARAKLAALFGDAPPTSAATPDSEHPAMKTDQLSESDKALAELNRLFSKD